MADILLALSNLLNEHQSEEEGRPSSSSATVVGQGSGSSIITPGSIGPAETQQQMKPKPLKKQEGRKSLWDESEVAEEGSFHDPDDKRPPPRYEIYYKQQVGTEDVFLGSSEKTPSSNDCSHIVVKIHFPGGKLADLDLDVAKRTIKAESSSLKLMTYLPLPVDHEKGNAKFDNKKEMLVVTLPILIEEL